MVENYQRYVSPLKEYFQAEKARQDKGEDRALELAQRLAKVLEEKYGATKVYLFGSLSENLFWEGSDIDIAVEGMNLNQYLKAIARFPILDGLQIDLVHLEYCKPRLRKRILQEGEVLRKAHGRQ